ncbi:MAG: RHS repeat-associated core domain-containing protein [Bacteroidota bacterium]
MRFQQNSIYLFIGLLCLGYGSQLFGQAEVFTNQLEGTPLVIGSTLVVADDKALSRAELVEQSADYYLHNRVILNIFPQESETLAIGEYQVLIELEYWDPKSDHDQAAPHRLLQELNISIDSTSAGVKTTSFSFNGANKVALTVKAITLDYQPLAREKSPRMQLVAELAMRQNSCTLDYDDDPGFALFALDDNTQQPINLAAFTSLDCVDEYDFEWTFLDRDSREFQQIDQGTDDPFIDDLFRGNATRVTSEQFFVRFNGLYRDGIVIGRYRAVKYDAFGNRRYTKWTGTGLRYSQYSFSAVTVNHEEGMNWQASTSFAEDAKQLPTISYLDGTLRPRQNLVQQYYNLEGDGLAQDEYSVSQQLIYDAMGRPAISTLPAPLQQNIPGETPPSLSPYPLEFVPENLARVDSPDPNILLFYGANEVEQGDCKGLALPMSSESGAGRYYSPDNLDLSRNAFVPDAEGYPFSVTRYTPDNTGRIRRQGGVGLTLQTGNGHDTRYYYGKPNQWELDRLFGVNVGYASHYEKHLVVDPNGQASVSYLDAKGRVIATALAGPHPDNLEALASYDDDAAPVTVSILNNVRTPEGLTTTFGLTVAADNDYDICYALNAAPVCDECFTPCLDCFYDVTITVSAQEDCGWNNGESIVVTYPKVSVVDAGQSCATIPGEENPLMNLGLLVGEYQIIKTIRINEEAYTENLATYLAINSCLDTREDFQQRFLDSIDLSNCEPLCDCSLPFNQLSDNCKEYCRPLSICDVLEEQIKADLRPGGQYATYDLTTVGTGANASIDFTADDATHPLSIFNSQANVGGVNNGTPYYAEVDYGPNLVDIDGQFVSPATLSIREYVLNWDNAWLDYLLDYHPEACFLSWCDANLDTEVGGVTSHNFDLSLQEVNTFAEAVSRGWASSNPNASGLPFVAGPLAADPYFSSTLNQNETATFEGLFIEYPIGTNGVVADRIIDYFELSYNEPSWSFSTAPTYQKDEAWRMFRGLYLGLKQQLQRESQYQYCLQSTTENGVHGNDWQCLAQPLCDAFPCDPVPGACDDDFSEYTARVLLHFRTPDNVGFQIASGTTFNATYLEAEVTNLAGIAAMGYCEDICSGYRASWRRDLENCPRIDANEIATILDFFEDICATGCSQGNYLGASSANDDGNTGLMYHSFDEVITAFLQDPGDCDTPDCGPYMIDFPPAQGNESFFGPLTIPAQEVPGFLARNRAWLEDIIENDLEFCYCNGGISRSGLGEAEVHTGSSITGGEMAYFDPNENNIESRPATRCNTFNFTGNGTELISLDVTPLDPAPSAVFASLGNNLIRVTGRVNDIEVDYTPALLPEDNSLQELVNGAAYRVEVNTPTTLEVCGTPIDPAFRLPLVVGTNWVGYMPQGEESVETYFSDVINGEVEGIGNLEQIIGYDPGQLVYAPNQSLYTLTTVKNGQGYAVTVGAPEVQDCLARNIAELNRMEYEEVFRTLKIIRDFLDDGISSGGFDTIDLVLPAELVPEATFCKTKGEIDLLLNEFSFTTNCNGPNSTEEDARTAFLNSRLGWDRTTDEYELFLAGNTPNCLICPPPIDNQEEISTPSCADELRSLAIERADLAYETYLENEAAVFRLSYEDSCLANLEETFNYTYQPFEYHYTLYYYDQAGNLAMTVPPEGVQPLTNPGDSVTISIYREALVRSTLSDNQLAQILPDHSMLTHYRYNNFNEVGERDIPDAVAEQTWYDPLGRPVLSRDGRQAMPNGSYPLTVTNTYSYTLYDDLGRIEEVGELVSKVGPSNTAPFVAAAEAGNLLQVLQDPSLTNGRKLVTRTFYNDTPLNIPAFTNGQNNLRNRVAAVTFVNNYNTNPVVYDNASHYTYDAVGNVVELVQEFGGLAVIGHQYKKIEYDFDYISGNVLGVYYQRGKEDEFAYRYEYDKTNRLAAVFSSELETEHANTGLWKRDATYSYYDHGPLRRMVIGQDRLQGMDYAYTIQGWIKGVNGAFGQDIADFFSNSSLDMNSDGFTANAVTFDQVDYRDLYRYSNAYFIDDYKPIGLGLVGNYNHHQSWIWNYEELYNGNIGRHFHGSGMESHITRSLNPRYDQLNRLVSGEERVTLGNPRWGTLSTATTRSVVEIPTYDGNGNILSLDRNAVITQPNLTDHTEDNNLSYQYRTGTNLLEWVDGTVNSSNGGFSPTDQIEGRRQYLYDPAGNIVNERLIQNGTTENKLVTWTHYGKVSNVYGTQEGHYQWANFGYGPDQNRWSKLTASGDFPAAERYRREYQVRDAQGNVLATYTRHSSGWSSGYQDLVWQEQYLYGSSRLGMVELNRALSPDPEFCATCSATPTDPNVTEEFGDRYYELSNHLGNVTVVFGEDLTTYSSNGGFTAPNVLRHNVYAPFGLNIALTPNSPLNEAGSYRYGFNGKENDEEGEWGSLTNYDYGFRIYNPAIARFLSVDPLAPDYPELTPYQFASNSPVAGVDLDGLEFTWFLTEKFEEWYLGSTFLSDVRVGFIKRGVKTITDLVHTPAAVANLMDAYSQDIRHVTSFRLCPTADCLGNDYQGKVAVIVKTVLKNTFDEYSDLIQKAADGDGEAIGALLFEVAAALVPYDEGRYLGYLKRGNTSGRRWLNDGAGGGSGGVPRVTRSDLRRNEQQFVDTYVNNTPRRNYAISRDNALSTNALRVLSRELGGVEVVQIYVKRNSGGGYYQVLHGSPGRVDIPHPSNGTPYLISHVHPSGNPVPSKADVSILARLQEIQRSNGQPVQSSSQIVPLGGNNSKFNPNSKTLDNNE